MSVRQQVLLSAALGMALMGSGSMPRAGEVVVSNRPSVEPAADPNRPHTRRRRTKGIRCSAAHLKRLAKKRRIARARAPK